MQTSARIAYYMPNKPLGSIVPSGDLAIGTGIYEFLKKQGHTIELCSRFKTRNFTRRVPKLLEYIPSLVLAVKRARAMRAEVWLTYHTYYKSPDVIGPVASRILNIPYVIVQGIYATKYRKRTATWAGFHLNKHALTSAHYVFCNKTVDFENVARLLPDSRLGYIKPGIETAFFHPVATFERNHLREQWKAGDTPVIFTAAMFRNGVKTKSIEFLLQACASLVDKGFDFHLILAGEGPNREHLATLAHELIPNRATFLGKLDRQNLIQCYNAADIFAQPGFNESLGMVFLEAGCCGLPCVAFNGWGIPDAIIDGKTGLLSPPGDLDAYVHNLATLLDQPELRLQMGKTARHNVLRNHDRDTNYAPVNELLSMCANLKG